MSMCERTSPVPASMRTRWKDARLSARSNPVRMTPPSSSSTSRSSQSSRCLGPRAGITQVDLATHTGPEPGERPWCNIDWTVWSHDSHAVLTDRAHDPIAHAVDLGARDHRVEVARLCAYTLLGDDEETPHVVRSTTGRHKGKGLPVFIMHMGMVDPLCRSHALLVDGENRRPGTSTQRHRVVHPPMGTDGRAHGDRQENTMPSPRHRPDHGSHHTTRHCSNRQYVKAQCPVSKTYFAV